MDIDLKAYYYLFRRRAGVLLACVMLCTLPTALLAKNTYTPIYQAASEFILDPGGGQRLDTGLIGVLIQSPAILDQVASWYPDLNMTAPQLGKAIEVSDVGGSAIMRVTAQHPNYERAVRIANDVTQVVKREIPKLMNADISVTVLNPARMAENPQPVNPKTNHRLKMVLMSFAASLVLGIGIVFLLDAMDDTLRKEADIRDLFSVSVLAVVPRMNGKRFRIGRGIRQAGSQQPAVKPVPFARTTPVPGDSNPGNGTKEEGSYAAIRH